MRYKCPKCGTEYQNAQECDWCPVQTVPNIPVLTDDCPDRLARMEEELKRIRPRAAMWDSLQLMCHRLGVKYEELVELVKERIRWRPPTKS